MFTATKATWRRKLKLLQHTVPSLLPIKSRHAWDQKLLSLFHFISFLPYFLFVSFFILVLFIHVFQNVYYRIKSMVAFLTLLNNASEGFCYTLVHIDDT